jgi:iron-sulfur cluster insertion protein
MLTLTENAITEIKNVLSESDEKFIRISIQGGGCSGFSYVFDFEKEMAEDDMTFNDVVLVDSMSLQYLAGAVVDYKEDLMGSSFDIQNPNAQTTCGCGSSFSV